VAVAVAGALRPVKGYNFEWRDSSQYKCNRKCNQTRTRPRLRLKLRLRTFVCDTFRGGVGVATGA